MRSFTVTGSRMERDVWLDLRSVPPRTTWALPPPLLACVTTMVWPPTVPTELAGAATVTVLSTGPVVAVAVGLVMKVGAADLFTMVAPVGATVLVTKVGLAVVKTGVVTDVADDTTLPPRS